MNKGSPDVAQSFIDRHQFLLRRLHSLSGIAPIGLFLISHLITNSSVIWGMMNGKYHDVHAGTATFQHEVNFIHSLPFLLLIEVFGLWLPIAFHAGLGIVYAIQGSNNTKRYAYQANWRYVLQRISGYIGVLFIFYHVATMRWGWTFLIPGGTKWSAEFAGSTLAEILQGGSNGMTAAGLAVSMFYMIGVSMLVFHFANGLWTSAITWGITISRSAQRRWGYACAGIGVMLMAAAWASVIGFATLDVGLAREAELRVNAGHAPRGEMVEGSEPSPGATIPAHTTAHATTPAGETVHGDNR